jgi:hypothetical protein
MPKNLNDELNQAIQTVASWLEQSVDEPVITLSKVTLRQHMNNLVDVLTVVDRIKLLMQELGTSD